MPTLAIFISISSITQLEETSSRFSTSITSLSVMVSRSTEEQEESVRNFTNVEWVPEVSIVKARLKPMFIFVKSVAISDLSAIKVPFRIITSEKRYFFTSI